MEELTRENTRVLVVDDDGGFRKEVIGVLRNLGYSQIEEVASGQSAIYLAMRYRPHLILMDTQMPGLKGYDACRRIRQGEHGNNGVIIGMSSGSYRREWIISGADDFLYKERVLNQSQLDENIQYYIRCNIRDENGAPTTDIR